MLHSTIDVNIVYPIWEYREQYFPTYPYNQPIDYEPVVIPTVWPYFPPQDDIEEKKKLLKDLAAKLGLEIEFK